MALNRGYNIILVVLIIAIVLPHICSADTNSPTPATANHGVGISQDIEGYMFMMVALVLGYLFNGVF
ncbi:hypothetical protein SUGI_0897570 [Cryptomeria japonica]|nr:hypothetical protein SUGI_0897570 [Cryptomeria japonica]